MKTMKQIRKRPALVPFQEFTVEPDKYRVEPQTDYSIQGPRGPSKLVQIIKEIARKKNIGR